MRVVLWGTCDMDNVRIRVLLRGLAENGVEVISCHRPIWKEVTDKSGLGVARFSRIVVKGLLAYPPLLWRYLRLPRHDAVLVGYPGYLDVLVLWAFARLRGVPVVLDAFLSVYNTVVEDRRILPPGRLLARMLWAFEWCVCRAAACVVLDTDAHGAYFRSSYGLASDRVGTVWVGVEPEAFPPQRRPRAAKRIRCLFYGKLIPLHGLRTILEAAALSQDEPIDWVLIGRGQEQHLIEAATRGGAEANLQWQSWVPYEELREHINDAHVCLGIFGDTLKAGMVIPNKVYQVLHAGRPLVTRRSAAINELLPNGAAGVRLVEPGNPRQLREAVLELGRERARQDNGRSRGLHADLRPRIVPRAIGAQMVLILEGLGR